LQHQAQNWPDQLLQIELLLALAYAAQQQSEPALAALTQALTLAEPNQLIRSLLDHGSAIQQLLQLAVDDGFDSPLIKQALIEFAKHQPAIQSQTPKLERLSERELEVLQQIATGLTDREIGERLYLSIYTVKVHARNIYAKLEVSNRTQAVARARTLGLLPHS
jgi:LuxR family transcriptional regulator, maltose regulon positive regulatory protein